MNLLEKYHAAFIRYGKNEAFFDGEKRYSYKEFSDLVQNCRHLLESVPDFQPGCAVGIVHSEKAETYAAVFAVWFAGGYFVPLHPASPARFNSEIIQKNGIRVVFAAKGTENKSIDSDVTVLQLSAVPDSILMPVFPRSKSDFLYVLNTSGSTGTPKNVPINVRNLEAFVEGFLEIYPELSENDKFLQTYDITADAAFTGYLIPLLIGAAVYTVPAGQFKPFQVAKTLAENPVTWVQVTPSLLACLQPFFGSLWFNTVTHFHFGGEALPLSLVNEWRPHIPNAEISNVYGPTETTITATIYKCLPGETVQARNNIVSVGKPLKHVLLRISEAKLPEEKTGELLIGGEQVMEKYLFVEKQPFITIADHGTEQKYYPSGDWVETGDDGLMYYNARIDDQVKINGYRVDLNEVENHVSAATGGHHVVAVAVEVKTGLKQLVVFVEHFNGDTTKIMQLLKSDLPFYKIPEKIIGVEVFPLSNSGKTDRKALIQNYLQSIEE
jgi:acyl-CoA synthetase (AMP-forming)/AMP-acid ligase II